MDFLQKLMKVFRDTQKSNFELKHHQKKSDDIYAMSLLQPLLLGYPFLPFNSTAIRPVVLSYLLNEILINNRKSIIEFGAGISTIVMARLLKKNNLKAKIISVEHDPEWVAVLRDLLHHESLSDYVELIIAPLREIDTDLGSVLWYDKAVLNSKLDNFKFDLLIVDGPPAHSSGSKFSRYPAFTAMKKLMEDDCCIVLDDVNREGEEKISKILKDRYPEYHNWVLSQSMIVFHSKPAYDPTPFYY